MHHHLKSPNQSDQERRFYSKSHNRGTPTFYPASSHQLLRDFIMAKDSYDSIRERTYGIPFWQTFYTTMYMLLSDVVLYGGILPVLAVYLAGSFVKIFSFGFTAELFLSVGLTFLLVYTGLGVIGETKYWRRLFNFEEMHGLILEIRDFVNVILLMISIGFISMSTQAIIADKGVKPTIPVSEGIGYISLKYTVLYLARQVGMEQTVADSIGLKPPHAGTLIDPSFGENESYEHGAAFMLSWALLTASVSKLIYFNVLFTYLRAMEIFLSLKPTFPDDDEDDDDDYDYDDDDEYNNQRPYTRRYYDKNLSAGQFPSEFPSRVHHSYVRAENNVNNANATWNRQNNQ